MSIQVIHLNLLQESEKLSSSPVRAKVVLPFVSGLLLAAALLWWGLLQFQLGMVGGELRRLQNQLSQGAKPHSEVLALKATLGALEAEKGQLRGYANGRILWGETLAAIAEVAPAGIQLTSIEIPDPPVQNLLPPPGVKALPLPGPTNPVESVVFRLAGRMDSESVLLSYLDALKRSSATNVLVFAESAEGKLDPSPRMKRFGQDAVADANGNRAIVFEAEYRTAGRNFAP